MERRRRRAAAERRLRPRRRASWRPRGRGWPRTASARSRRSSLRATGMAPGDRLDVVDAAGMLVDRRRKNGLVGHGEPPARYAAPARCSAATARACSTARSVLAAARRPEVARRGPGAVGVRRRPRVARAAARLALRRTSPRPGAWHVRFYSPTTRARAAGGAPAAAVPQPAADDGQERALVAATCPGLLSTRCWRSATCCCASASCCAATPRRRG